MAPNLVSDAIKQGLYTRIIGRRLLYYPRLASTMDEAAREAQAGAPEGTVVVAEAQTAGRGRFQRTWVSPGGNIIFSVVLYPTLSMLTYLSIIASLAVVRAISRVTGLEPSIKWPNDVRLHSKKVCGILVEDVVEGDRVRYAIVGVGINVAFDPATAPELTATATSLNVETGTQVDRGLLLRQTLQEMDDLYLSLQRGESPVGEWKALLETLGKQVEVRWKEEVYTGLVEDVDEAGNLLLRQQDGTIIGLNAGEVTFQK